MKKKIKEWLSNKNIIYIRQKSFEDCCDYKPLRFDFYLPNYNMCIEYQGQQHYLPIKFWGGEKAFKKNQKRDQIKREYCKKNNIKLLEIKYTENIVEILNKALL